MLARGRVLLLVGLLAVCTLGLIAGARAATAPTDLQVHRLVVLTDIGADPDDTQSLIRLLLYSNEIDIEGLIATTSVWRKTNPAPELIHEVIEKYGEVYPTLKQHAPGFPTKKALQSLVKKGSSVYGMLGVGEGKDSEGSDWIIRMLEKDDVRPLWISVWGGVNTLAQALYKIRETRTEEEGARLIGKLRVYTISDQDDSGIWIRREFPDLFYIVSPGDYGRSTWTAISRPFEGFEDYGGNSWVADNIQQGHGPLGAHYPDVVWGLEGDTPAYLSLIPNGLNAPEHPNWGGWGGRYELYTPTPQEIGVSEGKTGPGGVPLEPEPRPIWTNADDTYAPWTAQEAGRAIGPKGETYTSNKMTLLRWKSDFQRDFAARMDWTVMDYDEANHPPVPVLDHDRNLTVASGEYIELSASGTHDPDGDSLSYFWFNYAEAGTMAKPVDMGHAVNHWAVYFRAPEVEKPETLHFILRVTDKGEPPLSRYERVIVTVLPK